MHKRYRNDEERAFPPRRAPPYIAAMASGQGTDWRCGGGSPDARLDPTQGETAMKTSIIAASAMLAAIAVPMLAQAGPAAVPTFQAEKCYGVAKAGLNDCQTATHSCA